MEAQAEEEAHKSGEGAGQVERGNPTVAQYVHEFIDTLEASGSVEASTIASYRNSAGYLIQTEAPVAGVLLTELNARQAQDWVNALTAEGLSSSTVGKAYRLLKQALKRAVDFGELDKNPLTPVRPPKRKAPEPNALIPDMAARLARDIEESPDPSPAMVAAALALFAGLREGECCGLQWGDVVLTRDGGELNVRRSIALGNGGAYVKEPKTAQSKRAVPISATLARILAAQRVRTVNARAEAGVASTPDQLARLYVLGPVSGGYITPGHVGRGWHQVARALGLVGTRGRVPTFHDLRHSYGSLAIAAGADIRSVSAVMGHANVAMTLNVYADAMPEGKARAVQAVDDAITRRVQVLDFPKAAGGEGL